MSPRPSNSPGISWSRDCRDKATIIRMCFASLRLVMIVDFFLEGLEEFVFGAGLPGAIEPVRRAGRRNQRANDAALDHSIEVSCPRLKGWGLGQLHASSAMV